MAAVTGADMILQKIVNSLCDIPYELTTVVLEDQLFVLLCESLLSCLRLEVGTHRSTKIWGLTSPQNLSHIVSGETTM